ncbi:hypothetical protein EV178_002634 [Coemansia sp. RSA 1646]|nr:hypothetical protein EV178_002634 [Coemansia sp. RSA 1646]
MRGAQHYRYETSPPPSTLIWALYSGFTSFLAIVIVGVIDKYGAAIKNHHLPFAIAPAGASSVLIFGVPSSPLGQPRNMIVGHMIAAVIGTFMRELFKHASESFDWMPCALAVGISIGLMGLTNCYHPPAGATAFMAGYSSHTIKRVGWWFPLFPVLSLTLVLLVLGILFNNLARVYPVYWFTAAHFTYQNAHDRKAMAEATEDNGGSDRTMAEETSGANSTTSSLDIFVGFPPMSCTGEAIEQHVNDVTSNEADAERAWMYARICELEAELRRLGGDPGGNLTRHRVVPNPALHPQTWQPTHTHTHFP